VNVHVKLKDTAAMITRLVLTSFFHVLKLACKESWE
jgi:hypothetical protein